MLLSGETKEKIVLDIPNVDRIYVYTSVGWGDMKYTTYSIERMRLIELLLSGAIVDLGTYSKQNGMLSAASKDSLSWDIYLLNKVFCTIEAQDLVIVAKTLNKLEDAFMYAIDEIIARSTDLRISELFKDIVRPMNCKPSHQAERNQT